MKEQDKVKPIKVTDNDTGMTYTLEFNRESVKYAESKGFDLNDIAKKPLSTIPDLWYYAFRMHHKMLPREKADKMLDALGHIPTELITRLAELYAVPYEVFTDNGEQPKNAKVVVEL